jgi:hypothetical protein
MQVDFKLRKSAKLASVMIKKNDMKKVIIFLSFFLFTLVSCKDDNCENDDPICSETPPTDEECLAFFERWFYDSSTSTCEKIGYSGCDAYGFATKIECETCECDD